MSHLKPVNKFLCLQTLCESNFRKLLRLIPHLPALDKNSIAHMGDKPALHLSVHEKAPYTLILELSYYFEVEPQPLFEPALKLRVYLDAGMVEVLSDCERPRKRWQGPMDQQMLEHKWRLNYFLDKWLDHCLHHGYRFSAVDGDLQTVFANA
ncbi:MAG: hypothetical protein AXA67_10940 [Methylothermaceae bacteria B42]|nr:MAG: hypothetical protein AXA67_10940 [Methylothermaceae bacteria B42]HHJ38990.1 DUF1249 domain-containing protein [Methylothermaceae bacterium]